MTTNSLVLHRKSYEFLRQIQFEYFLKRVHRLFLQQIKMDQAKIIQELKLQQELLFMKNRLEQGQKTIRKKERDEEKLKNEIERKNQYFQQCQNKYKQKQAQYEKQIEKKSKQIEEKIRENIQLQKKFSIIKYIGALVCFIIIFLYIQKAQGTMIALKNESDQKIIAALRKQKFNQQLNQIANLIKISEVKREGVEATKKIKQEAEQKFKIIKQEVQKKFNETKQLNGKYQLCKSALQTCQKAKQKCWC